MGEREVEVVYSHGEESYVLRPDQKMPNQVQEQRSSHKNDERIDYTLPASQRQRQYQ